MGTSKLVYCNDRYRGHLSEEQCNVLESIIQLNAQGGCAEPFKTLIYNMSDEDVLNLIKDYEKLGYESREYERPLGQLRDYQTLGVTFAHEAGNFILGDSVGMGKTVVTAAYYNLCNCEAEPRGETYNCLILTEKNLAKQVQLEMVKFSGNYFKRIASGEKKDVEKFLNEYPPNKPLTTSVVGTHALLTTPAFIDWIVKYNYYFDEPPFQLLVIDESSVLGGKKDGKMVTGFRGLATYFEKIIFLNATPFETNLGVFYNQLNLLDSWMLPTKADFEKTYCIMRWNGMYSEPTGKYKNQEDFKRRIGYFYFARTRKDNGAELKNCEGGIIYSPLSPKQKYLLNRTHMNRFVFDCPTYLDDTIPFDEENVPKLKSLRELLNTKFKDAESILLFAYNKETQLYLQQWFLTFGIYSQVLNGDTNNKDREQIIDDFKNSRMRVLITNVQKGLNFGACNHVVFFGFDSNPSKMVQFEGRTTRAFNIENKHIYILCSEGLESTQLQTRVMTRAKATTNVTNVDISVVMDILLNNDNEEE